ncbi:hypothetical protein EDB81DRAFT_893318 [Dactylonectria macrodidyma]|uniref:BZIP domain-containing protein n=1 Tax=Dactylonectria macrodidyma TaxID=307937 RepID=A0A9P9D5Q5_9HYPO|nr:hypothetical protein EDB81DRAFT_893318 [Dactylonectria macrodidyma]
MDEGTSRQFNALAGEPTLDPFNIPPDLPWEQWWSMDQSALVGSLQEGGGMIPASAQTNFLPGGYACGYTTNSLGDSTSPSPNTEYTPMTSVAEQTVFQESTASVDRLELPATEKEPGLQRQKRDSDEHPTRNITKRDSVQNDEIKAQLPRDSEHLKSHRDSSGSSGSSGSSKHNGKNDKSDINNANKNKNSNKSTSKNKATKNDDKSNSGEYTTGLNSGGESQRIKRIQRRNRIASSKFRVKKKADALKLKSDLDEMERINRDLSSRVADLTHNVYLLNMQLLHTDCTCSMIQDYIKQKAHRYAMGTNELSPNEDHHHQQS